MYVLFSKMCSGVHAISLCSTTKIKRTMKEVRQQWSPW